MAGVFESYDYGNGKDGPDKSSTRTLSWYTVGYTTETSATAAVVGSVPDTIAITGGPGYLYKQDLTWTREGPDVYKFVANYIHPDRREEDVDTGSYVFSFDTMGGREKMIASLATVSSTAKTGATAADFKGLSNYDGKKAAGVDITIPALQFQIQKRQPNATVAMSYVQTLAGLTGKTNDASFLTWDTGEVLFLGARGKQESAADPEITYYFSAGPNVTNLTVGPSITVPAKNAHDYLWVFYDKQEDTTAKKLVAQPLQANVERVYEAGDFSDLSI